MKTPEQIAEAIIQRANDGYHRDSERYPSYALAPWDDRIKWTAYIKTIAAEVLSRRTCSRMTYVFGVRATSDEQVEEMRHLAGVYDMAGASSTYGNDMVIFHIPDKGRAANFRLFYDEYILCYATL